MTTTFGHFYTGLDFIPASVNTLTKLSRLAISVTDFAETTFANSK